MPKKRKFLLRTVLVVTEGYTDKAFAEHLKSLYITRGCGVSVKIRNAKGKGADNVMSTALGVKEGYDRVVCFFDDDLPLKKVLRNKAERQKFVLIASSPCLEGLFLNILEMKVPGICHACKRSFSPIIDGADGKEASSYASIFSKDILEKRRLKIPVLDKLICAFE